MDEPTDQLLTTPEVSAQVSRLKVDQGVIVVWCSAADVEDEANVDIASLDTKTWIGVVVGGPEQDADGNYVATIKYDGDSTLYSLPNEDIRLVSITVKGTSTKKTHLGSYVNNQKPKLNQFSTYGPLLTPGPTAALQHTALRQDLMMRHDLLVTPDPAQRGRRLAKLALLDVLMLMVDAVHAKEISVDAATRSGGKFCAAAQRLLIELEGERVQTLGGSRKVYTNEAVSALEGPKGTYDKIELKALRTQGQASPNGNGGGAKKGTSGAPHKTDTK